MQLASIALAGALALAASTTAHAGGIGLMTVGGLHTQPVYFYDAGNNMVQLRQSQTLLSGGLGFDLVLGDRSDRIAGTFRGYWTRDSAEKDPATLTQTVSPENVVANWRETPSDIGVAEVGVQFGFLGSPDRLQAIATLNIGSGFLTTDHTEFLIAEAGVGATWMFSDTMQAVAQVNYAARQRKGLRHGANGFLGVRYLFD